MYYYGLGITMNAAMHCKYVRSFGIQICKISQCYWTTAAGMYVGHYMAWIAASLLYAVYLKAEASAFLADGVFPPVAPWPISIQCIRWFGIFA